MRGIILAGGKGTRLLDCTKVTNKHLLPVYHAPMIYYPIETLKEAGITDIMIITGKEHAGDFIELLGDGNDIDCKFTYRVQKDADGIAGALMLCEDFVGDDDMLVILGDNIFEMFELPKLNPFGATLFLKSIRDPERFGVVRLDEKENVIEIVEKPEKFISNNIVTGLYHYNSKVWDYLKQLKKSDRGEYEITDINNLYIKDKALASVNVSTFWQDAGTPEGLFRASAYVRKKCIEI